MRWRVVNYVALGVDEEFGIVPWNNMAHLRSARSFVHVQKCGVVSQVLVERMGTGSINFNGLADPPSGAELTSVYLFDLLVVVRLLLESVAWEHHNLESFITISVIEFVHLLEFLSSQTSLACRIDNEEQFFTFLDLLAKWNLICIKECVDGYVEHAIVIRRI